MSLPSPFINTDDTDTHSSFIYSIYQDVESIAACLDLTHSFGEVQLLLRYYHPHYSEACPEFFNPDSIESETGESETGLLALLKLVNFQFVYPGTSKKLWKRLASLIEGNVSKLILPMVGKIKMCLFSCFSMV